MWLRDNSPGSRANTQLLIPSTAPPNNTSSASAAAAGEECACVYSSWSWSVQVPFAACVQFIVQQWQLTCLVHNTLVSTIWLYRSVINSCGNSLSGSQFNVDYRPVQPCSSHIYFLRPVLKHVWSLPPAASCLCLLAYIQCLAADCTQQWQVYARQPVAVKCILCNQFCLHSQLILVTH